MCLYRNMIYQEEVYIKYVVLLRLFTILTILIRKGVDI